MYIARLLYPVRVLGPGRRVGIWFAGCSRRCRGCSNPELWERDPRFLTDRETVLRMIAAVREISPVDGFISVGIHRPEYPRELREALRTRGVTIGNPAAEESLAGRKPHSDNTKD